MTQVAERSTPVSPQVARFAAEFPAATSSSQPHWLGKLREGALASFERLGFPTTKHEQWRFTSVTPIAEKTFALATDGPSAADAALLAPIGGARVVAVCVNGRFTPGASSLSATPKGVQVMGLEDALASNPSLV